MTMLKIKNLFVCSCREEVAENYTLSLETYIGKLISFN